MAVTRRSERRAHRACEFGSRLGYWRNAAGAAGAQSGFISLTCPDRNRNLHLPLNVQMRLRLNSEGSRIRFAGPVC
jgi:hypothetical protein